MTMLNLERNGFKWNVNELLQLEREFDLLKLPLDEIAKRHKRSVNAIMYKLADENIADYNVLYSNYYDLNDQMDVYNEKDNVSSCKKLVKENLANVSNVDINNKFNRLENQLNELVQHLMPWLQKKSPATTKSTRCESLFN